MSRHATSVVSDPTPAAPLRVAVSWVAIVARDGLGASTNALLAAPPGPAGTTGSGLAATRRLRLIASLETTPGDPETIRFSAAVEEDGRRRSIGPAGRMPGSVTVVGDHVHLTVEPEDEAGPLLMVVMDSSDRPLMVRSRLAELIGLSPAATGRADAAVLRAPRSAGIPSRRVLAE